MNWCITHHQKAFIAGISYSYARGDCYTHLVSLSQHVVCSKSLFPWTFYKTELSTLYYKNLRAASYFQSEITAREILFSPFLLSKRKEKDKISLSP